MLLLFPFGHYLSKQKDCQKTMRQKYCILTIFLTINVHSSKVYRNFLNKYCHLFILPSCLLFFELQCIRKSFTNLGITVACGLKFHRYLRTLSLKFQKARSKTEVFLSLPCWLSAKLRQPTRQRQENFNFACSLLLKLGPQIPQKLQTSRHLDTKLGKCVLACFQVEVIKCHKIF